MNETKSSILLFSEDTALRERVAEILEREIDVNVVERVSQDQLSGLTATEFAAAVVDTGSAETPRSDLLEALPSSIPLLTLYSSPDAPKWIHECRPTGESLRRDAADERIIHALRLSLVRTNQELERETGVKDSPRRAESTEVRTQSVLGDLRAEFRTDLVVAIRDCEEAVQAYSRSANASRAVASDRVVPVDPEQVKPSTSPGIGAPLSDSELPVIGKLIDRVRYLRRLSDTLDLAEYAPLLFALEVSLRDLPSDEGRTRVRDLLRQVRNVVAGRPASAGFEGRRIRLSLIGASADEAHALSLEDPDRLDVRPVKDVRTFARQVDIFRPDVVVLKADQSGEDLMALRELRGGTTESVILLLSGDLTTDPIDTLRFPKFAEFHEPFAWNSVIQRVFEFEGEMERQSSVLIVHDSEAAIREVEHCLDPESFVVQSVTSASEILEQMYRRGPDLLIIADELEKVSGFDICREIRAELPLARIPIILISERGDRAGREQAFRVGADDFLTLPLIPEEIRRRASNLIEYRRLRYEATARDSLTGLRDACTLVDHLTVALEEASGQDEWLSFLALDIDRYSMIRNFYGLSSANTIVRSVADALRKIFEHDDMIFRGTDDEFFVIRKRALRDDASRDAIFDGIADVGRLTFRSADGRGFYATVTGGHVLIPPGVVEVEDCVRRTMRVLNAAKKMARGKIMSAEMDPDF